MRALPARLRRLAWLLPLALLPAFAAGDRSAGERAAGELAAAELAAGEPVAGGSAAGDGTCIDCHAGIEDIHPGYKLSCVACHGGDATAAAKDKAHVLPKATPPGDERVLPANFDLDWQRFRNPSNLRVAATVCGDCHEVAVQNVLKSLHATTCGHLGDGYYEHGLSKSRTPGYAVFPVQDDDGEVPPGALKSAVQVPAPSSAAGKGAIASHYADLPRKACMHCHLWSPGRAVRGRVGMDGDYRGEGCAACHVAYADDGRSRSADQSIDKLEPGHPQRHRFQSRIETATCARCHYGDASIGLSFQGLAQLVPGQPAGPEVPGTTDKLHNGQFYQRDKDRLPPDVHHQRGMHCIDCHTQQDTMGDGNLWPQMDHAVEIECESCHGSIDAVSDLLTSRGRRVPNLFRDGDEFYLVSKVTGRRHPVVQARHVVDPQHKRYHPGAAAAMTSAHGRLECYACHSSWNVDFFGFHFDRNEQFTQLDLLSGKRTPGRVTTQEKVFAAFDQLRLGINHEARVAPYMVGFSTIGSFRGEDGGLQLHEALPVTARGLSGVTLVPHQTHTVRPEARQCVECHRSPATWGLGSSNFRLTREYGYAITGRGLYAVAIDGRQLPQSQPVADLPLPFEPRALALRMDPVRGRATHAYVAGDGVLAVVDLQSPVLPRLLAQRPGPATPRRLLAQGDWLYVAEGSGGLSIWDLDKPDKPKLAGAMPSLDARALALQWPWLYLADGIGGLVVADVSDPAAPRALCSVDLNQEAGAANEALDVAALFQYSRTRAVDALGERLARSPARMLLFVACGLDGVRIVDATEPSRPQLLHGKAHEQAFAGDRLDVRGVAMNSQFDLGSPGGGLRSQERDYLFVYCDEGPAGNRQQHVRAYDVSDPLQPRRAAGTPRVYGGSGRLLLLRCYNEPFLQQFVVAAGAGGLGTVVDASKMPQGLQDHCTWDDLDGVRELCFEEFAFDRLQDERFRPEKDISHEQCRYLDRDEVLRVLRAPVPVAHEQQGRYGRLRDAGRPPASGNR